MHMCDHMHDRHVGLKKYETRYEHFMCFNDSFTLDLLEIKHFIFFLVLNQHQSSGINDRVIIPMSIMTPVNLLIRLPGFTC